MFVRWTTRTPWRAYKDFPHRNPRKSFSAVLVRSERTDGEPRQRIVCYLGHLKEEYLDSQASQLSFWEGVDCHLDALALTLAERRGIEEQLRTVVARPTPEEVERDKHEVLDKLLKYFGRL
jgi:hypothetical protein